jgi:hypothetical protein
VEGSSGHGSEPSGCIKCGQFLDYLKACGHLKKYSAACSWLVGWLVGWLVHVMYLGSMK